MCIDNIILSTVPGLAYISPVEFFAIKTKCLCIRVRASNSELHLLKSYCLPFFYMHQNLAGLPSNSNIQSRWITVLTG